jgi:glycerol-3-phosphate dehydrogenase subunit B
VSDKVLSADLVVIGSGLAGTAAALAAREKGLEVCLVASDRGASAMGSGALDLCGDPCSVPGQPQRTSREFAHNLRELLLRNSGHPFHLLSDSENPEPAIIALFEKALAAIFNAKADSMISGSAENSRPFLTNLGTFKFSAFADRLTAVLDDPLLARPLAIGFFELADFDPNYWLKAAKANAEMMGVSMEPTGAITARLELGGEMSSLELAKHLESKGSAEAFVQRLARVRGRFTEASAAVIPAVLPFSKRDQILEELKEKTGLTFLEILSLPPSVPGQRLSERLAKRLEEESVVRVFGKVKGYRAGGRRIISIHVESSLPVQRGRPIKVEGAGFILASGSFLGGGLRKDPHFRETIFDLPVFCDNQIAGEIFTEKLTRVSIRGPHPLFAVGIKADHELRPIGRDRKPAFENLRAAGSILAGSNYLAHGTGAGVALATGFQAGTLTVQL